MRVLNPQPLSRFRLRRYARFRGGRASCDNISNACGQHGIPRVYVWLPRYHLCFYRRDTGAVVAAP
jgi:hypothetical protein